MKPVIEIIVNKNWEIEPFLNAMTNSAIKPPDLPLPDVLLSPKDSANRMASCRAEYHLSNANVVVRCIQDLMDPIQSPSNSEEKYRVLPGYITADKPSIVISVSTSESAPGIQKKDNESENGSVFIGGAFFMFDAHSFDPSSPSHLKVIEFHDNNVDAAIYNLFDQSFINTVVPKFLTVPNMPAKPMRCIANPYYASIGVVNVINYQAYEKADPAAYDAFTEKYKPKYTAATIETTHGIVRMSAGNIPTLFVSPITDRYTHFNDDVDKQGVQNTTASYNAGVAAAELLIRLNKLFNPQDS